MCRNTLPCSPLQVSPQPSLLELKQQQEATCPPQTSPGFASGSDANVNPIPEPDKDPTLALIVAPLGDNHMSPANVVEKPGTSISQVSIGS